MLAHRLRRWANIQPTLVLVFSGNLAASQNYVYRCDILACQRLQQDHDVPFANFFSIFVRFMFDAHAICHLKMAQGGGGIYTMLFVGVFEK